MGGTAPVPDFKIEAKGVGGEGHPETKRNFFAVYLVHMIWYLSGENHKKE